MKKLLTLTIGVGLLASNIGCTNQSTQTAKTAEEQNHDDHEHHGEGGHIKEPVAPSAEGEKFVLDVAPENPMDVIEARESVKDADEVILFGQIGGSQNPWVEGRAIFTLVDDSLQSCNEIPGDGCPTPWDYCCRTPELKSSSALVKVVDENGAPVKVDARELLGVRELTSVIVKGKAQRDEAGNLTVLANGIHVKK